MKSQEVGKIYEGKVVGIKDFGAFVNILPGIVRNGPYFQNWQNIESKK
ncbi:S1 RNA-binding domain-containing protein [Candidatus Minimicrobia naudis]|uniref:S1 RNA-binding domain-containing protein n=1 Tax=Candidatus Minimicrobia naudis TaxID=2841263 RepID=A0A8F1MD44_9BACT|nr:S1 RNA-binding domain-containing protein [Candidatus Minimicrobia naudis]